MRERPISSVPLFAMVLLVMAFGVQLAWHFLQAPPRANAEDLTVPPALSTLRLASFGDPIALAKSLMLYVQAFDNQSGVQMSFHQLNYAMLESWLTRISQLDPQSQYPQFAASRLYGEINDEAKQRRMFEWVYQQFLLDPNHRWKYLAHVASLSKHRLHDLPLALKYAKAIRTNVTARNVPTWATQMELFLLEDMNELQSAKILIGGLMQSGEITDPYELRFLEQRLHELEDKEQTKEQAQRTQKKP